MISLALLRSSIGAACAAIAFLLTTAAVMAQVPAALPTAPGAVRAVTAGPAPTAALASLPGGNGSPVEPYLFLFILAGGGLICLIAVVITNRILVSGYNTTDRIYTK